MGAPETGPGQGEHMQAGVCSYHELKAYRTAFQLQQRLFTLSRAWPREETHALTARLLRSARSIGADLAHVWARQPEAEEFRMRLRIAAAEIAETTHWLETAHDCGYLSAMDYAGLRDECQSLSEMLVHARERFPLGM